ncbi:ABC transporter substrate-binding protein [Propionibacteriaceae bacterium G1746]|uniref:ABC transporter substrate-binding protein n=1 Tax=Aestuariimicrobium sp. G57 TaxID=3418485 RepID=UPI003C20C087
MIAKRFKGAALVLAVALTAAGCGGAAQASASDEIVYAIDSATLGFDPNVTPAAQDARVMRQIYDGLVSKADDGTIVASLAEKWQVSDDGTTYTFTLRQGVTYHDGTDFNAEAVCFNFDRIKNPKTGSRYAISLIGPYKSCAAPDPHTAIITMSQPYAPFLSVLTSPFLGLVSPTAVTTLGAETFNLKPVGTGPFKLTSYVPMGSIVLERNDDYNWAPRSAKHDGPAHLKKITFQIMPDPTVRLGSLRTGRIQALGNVPETEAERTKGDKSLQFFAQPQSGSPHQLYFNQQRVFADEKLRQAFVHSVNVETIVKALYFGVYQQASGNLSTTTPGHDPSLKDLYTYDPEKAKQLLDEAGWVPGPDGVRVKDGKRLTITYAEQTPNREKRQDIAQFVKSYATQVGFEVNIVLEQVAGLTARSQSGDYDIYGLSLVNVDPNVVHSVLGSPFQPAPKKNGFNFAHVTKYDDVLLKAQAEQDETTRIQMYKDVQKQLAADAVSLPTYVPTYTMAIRGIDGLRFDGEGYPVFYDVKPI